MQLNTVLILIGIGVGVAILVKTMNRDDALARLNQSIANNTAAVNALIAMSNQVDDTALINALNSAADALDATNAKIDALTLPASDVDVPPTETF